MTPAVVCPYCFKANAQLSRPRSELHQGSTGNCCDTSSRPPGTHFLLWVTLNGERQEEMKKWRDAACAAQRSLPHSNSWSSLRSCVMRKITGTHLSTASNYHFILLGFWLTSSGHPQSSLPITESLQGSCLYPERETGSLILLWRALEMPVFDAVKKWDLW